LVEIKTTAAYSIKLETIGNYRAKLTQQNLVSKIDSSCLIVVGRQDTDGLEAQLRGSEYNKEMRIVSLAALFDALELFEQLDDPTLVNRLIGVFKPKEYTRIDDIIALANQFADDRSVITNTPNNPEGDGNKLPKQTNETELKIF
tara:strand:- start:560 stop:994 length:435 start_codon:yes stop_codon:yes gene_type:complete